MDKLKAQLEPVAKHWFWIVSALVMLGSLGIWWMASGQLIAEFEAARSKIEGDASMVSAVSSKLNEHPNLKTHSEMDLLIQQREQSVLDAWTSVFDRQQDILVWPVGELTDDFIEEFKELIPIELKVPFPTESMEKETLLLNQYRYYIGNVLPGIAEIAKTKWTAPFDRNAAMATGGGMYDGMDSAYLNPTGLQEEGPLVNWDTASQESLLSDLFPWRGGQPSTLQVLYSQENLWILRQLMQIIADVNGDAGQRFQAKIHDITRIAIGSSVPPIAGAISLPSIDSLGGMDMSGMDMSSMDMDMGMGMDDGSGMMGMGGDMGMGMGEIRDPGDNRYVDPSGKPLLASQLRAALSSNTPEDAFMAVAKRIPVMMSFKMDQRAVPELIAKCGSAPLMVEVRQVRILPTGASTSVSMDASYGGGGYESGGYESGGYDMGSYDTGGMDAMAGMPSTERFPMDMFVEVYGIIYMYNPPLAEKLGVEQVTEETIIEGTKMIDGQKIEPPPAPVETEEPEALPPPSLPTEPPAAAVPDAGDTPPGADAAATPAQPALPSQPAPSPEPAPSPAVPPVADGALWLPRNKMSISANLAIS